MIKTLAVVCLLFLISGLMAAPVTADGQQTAGIQVGEAKLGKSIQGRQIADETNEFSLNDKVYLWLRITGAAGESLKITWRNGGRTYTSDLAVGGSPWRTWCYKTAALAGEWTVTVSDSKGNILKELNFKVK